MSFRLAVDIYFNPDLGASFEHENGDHNQMQE
jgi:hypothetical protein